MMLQIYLSIELSTEQLNMIGTWFSGIVLSITVLVTVWLFLFQSRRKIKIYFTMDDDDHICLSIHNDGSVGMRVDKIGIFNCGYRDTLDSKKVTLFSDEEFSKEHRNAQLELQSLPKNIGNTKPFGISNSERPLLLHANINELTNWYKKFIESVNKLSKYDHTYVRMFIEGNGMRVYTRWIILDKYSLDGRECRTKKFNTMRVKSVHNFGEYTYNRSRWPQVGTFELIFIFSTAMAFFLYLKDFFQNSDTTDLTLAVQLISLSIIIQFYQWYYAYIGKIRWKGIIARLFISACILYLVFYYKSSQTVVVVLLLSMYYYFYSIFIIWKVKEPKNYSYEIEETLTPT